MNPDCIACMPAEIFNPNSKVQLTGRSGRLVFQEDSLLV